jgi:hypothetical protein
MFSFAAIDWNLQNISIKAKEKGNIKKNVPDITGASTWITDTCNMPETLHMMCKISRVVGDVTFHRWPCRCQLIL